MPYFYKKQEDKVRQTIEGVELPAPSLQPLALAHLWARTVPH